MTARRRAPRQPPAAAGSPLPVASSPRWLVPATVTLATGAAILERWWFARAWGETATVASAFYQGDAIAFMAFARAIALGEPFDNGIPYHPPGWPYFLSWFVGHVMSAAGLELITACLSGLTVGLTALLAWRIAGRGPMLAAALLGTFHFGHLVAASVPNSEALYGLAVVVTLLAAHRWIGDDPGGSASQSETKWGWAAATGAAAGAAALVRAEFLLGGMLFLIAAWLLAARGERPAASGRERRREAAAFALAFALALTPTTVAHWQSLSAFNAAHETGFPGPLPRFAPVTSYGAFNFAMANHDFADGEPNRDHPMLAACGAEATALLEQGQLELACPAAYELYVDGYAIGAGWLLTHPGDAAWLWWRKTTMAMGALAHGYLTSNVGAGVSGVRRRVDMLDPDGRVLLPLHLLLIVGGVYLLRGRPRALVILAIPAATLVASTLLFYGYVRLVIAYMPILWVCQSVACGWVASRVAPRPLVRHAPAAVLAAALVLLAAEGLRVDNGRAVSLDGPRLPDGTLLQDETLDVTRVR